MKMKKVSLIFVLLVGLSRMSYTQTVTIGSQVWMTKNLNVDKFRNGDPIPQAKTDEEWENARENKHPAWCYYENDPANGAKYGKLYNWYAVNDSRGLTPEGWKIPSDEDWNRLTDFLGGKWKASTKMKTQPNYEIKIRFVEEGGYDETKWVSCNNCSYWTQNQKANNPCNVCRNQRGRLVKTGKYIPTTKRKIEDKINIGWDGTNESGFSGLPGGYRGSKYSTKNSLFFRIGETGYWWSSTEYNNYHFGSFHILYSNGSVDKGIEYKGNGYSVRCLRD